MENELKAGNQELIKEFNINDLDDVLVNRDSTKNFFDNVQKSFDEKTQNQKL